MDKYVPLYPMRLSIIPELPIIQLTRSCFLLRLSSDSKSPMSDHPENSTQREFSTPKNEPTLKGLPFPIQRRQLPVVG